MSFLVTSFLKQEMKFIKNCFSKGSDTMLGFDCWEENIRKLVMSLDLLDYPQSFYNLQFFFL